MACYHPIKGWRSRTVNPSGKRSLVFNVKQAYNDMPVDVPCGQCIGCRLERSRQWAIRIMHEAQEHADNCFITLTYADEFLPEDFSLHKEHFQKFLKRLRKHADITGQKIRYFHCGEYGEKFARPHYHACIFGYDFSDKLLFRSGRRDKIYTSSILEKLWPFGYATIGKLTFESAAYVARYCTKKITGKLAEESQHYDKIDYATGEVWERLPEYNTMSLKPGIGYKWYEKYHDDVYPRDEVIIKGKKVQPPKFYDRLYELQEPVIFRKIKNSRKARSLEHISENTHERLAIREQVQLKKFEQLKRNYENELPSLLHSGH